MEAAVRTAFTSYPKVGLKMSEVVLASASPRRRQLLSLLLADFRCLPMDVDEAPLSGETPEGYVLRLARLKAQAARAPRRVVIGSDTTVCLRGELLHKPQDYDDAYGMLSRLSGQTHQVFTAISIANDSMIRDTVVRTDVVFDSLDDALIGTYINTGECWDKAGAYGIQGFAGSFVKRIEGSFSSVVGLPLRETRQILSEFGVEPAPAVNSQSSSDA